MTRATITVATLAFATHATAQLTIIAQEGLLAPTNPAAAYQTIDRPNIGPSGHIVFAADTDDLSDFDDVIVVDDALAAQQGAFSPGGNGLLGTFEFFETGQQVNAAGRSAFIVTLTLAGTLNREVVRVDDTGALVSVAIEGDLAPDTGGRVFSDFGFAGIFDDDTVGFLATLDNSDSATDSAIMRDGNVLYQEGGAVPGMPGLIWDGNFDEVQWNAAGDVLFEGNTSDVGGRDMVLLRNVGGVEEIVAQEEQFVDARAGLDFLELILQSALADNGDWAFRGNLGVAPSASDAVVIAGNGFYAQQGDPIPELPGAVLGNFNGVDTNSVGDVLYLADIENAADASVDEGLFLNGELLVATGTITDDLPFPLSDIGFEDIFINDARQIVFQASEGGFDTIYRLDLDTGCPCDFAEPTGTGDVLDLLGYLDPWFDNDPSAEFTGDAPAEIDVLDLLAFLDCWFQFSTAQTCD